MALKYHFDAIEKIDSNLNVFFSKQLEQIRPQLYEKKYPEFKARRLVPIKNDINVGAEAYTTRTIDEAGEAEFVTDLGDDAPMAEVTGASEDSYKMRMIQLAYGWHLQEARAAQFAGLNLSDRKATACRRGIERFIDRNLLIGSTTGGLTLQGLFTLSGSQAPVAYTDGPATWEDESSDDIYSALMGFVSKIYIDSKEIEIPDTMILPNSTKQLLMNRRMGDANNSSILKFFLESNDFVKTIETSHYLEADAGSGAAGGLKRAVVYKKDPEMLEGLVNEFEQLPPEFKGARVVTTCLARVGGIAAHRPKSIGYMDGI